MSLAFYPGVVEQRLHLMPLRLEIRTAALLLPQGEGGLAYQLNVFRLTGIDTRIVVLMPCIFNRV